MSTINSSSLNTNLSSKIDENNKYNESLLTEDVDISKFQALKDFKKDFAYTFSIINETLFLKYKDISFSKIIRSLECCTIRDFKI